MASDEFGYICHYNENIRCQDLNCADCGWNPVISEKRLERILKKLGIDRKEPEVRLIDAIDAEARIRTGVMPLVEAGQNPWRIYAEVMKCLRAAEAVASGPVRCIECSFSRPYTQRGSAGYVVCHNEKSPCNKRKVKDDDYCPYGERRTDGQENNGVGSTGR